MVADYLGLNPLEQAVLWRMLERGRRFRPYNDQALTFYREQTKTAISQPQVQTALESLHRQMPDLIWKSARGEYAVSDDALSRWYQDRKKAGTWPPTAAQFTHEIERE